VLPLFVVVQGVRCALLEPLGRDQGIFQYVAWAVARGAVDYRDVRDINGPLTHLVHLAFLALGGADEYRFHALDLAVTGMAFAFVGACLPGLRARSAPTWPERAAWALAGWVVLDAQYLQYVFWDHAQRESFADWFMLPSVALQLVAQAPWLERRSARRPLHLLGVTGALSAVSWFGKPTYVLFTLAQLAALVLDRHRRLPIRRALVAFAIGSAAGAATQIAYLVACGDLVSFLRIQLVDAPALYRFLWPRSAWEILSYPPIFPRIVAAVGGAAVLLGLVASGEMPPRVIAVALVPLCGFGSIVAQGKGFTYHYHPVTAGLSLQGLVFAAWAAERTRTAARRRAWLRLVPVAVGGLLGLHVVSALEDSPGRPDPWQLRVAARPAQRETPDYFAPFMRQVPGWFPFELREAAAFLRARTGPDDSVQIYGMDPYVLFLARRSSATPYIYAFDLDADCALNGGTGGRPNPVQAARIRAIRDAHEADMLARLEARPPAAFVFLDDSVFITQPDAWRDFAVHCPEAAAWVSAHYRESAAFGHLHVWLRLDPAAGRLRTCSPPCAPG
jgi:hypothetical protein